MPNPFFAKTTNQTNPKLNLNPEMIQQAKNMLAELNACGNPASAMSLVSQKFPALQTVLSLIKGKNPEEVFKSECKRLGVNPEDILSQIK